MTEWRDVSGYEALYCVSDEGVVWSKRRKKAMSPSTGKWGHLRVVLYDKPRPAKTMTVHKLVKNSFDGPTPDGLQVLHNDGNPANNRLDNLRFGTPSENMLDKERHGTNHNRNREHCPRGHKLISPNLQPAKLKMGWRGCRACHQAHSDRFNGHPGTFEELADLRYKKLIGTSEGDK